MFSCAKSGPLSGSGCEGTEKKNTEAHAQVNEGEEEEERKRERRKKRGGEETLLSRSAAFPFFFECVCLVKRRTQRRHKGI